MNIANIHEGKLPAQLLFVFKQIERIKKGYTLATKPPISPVDLDGYPLQEADYAVSLIQPAEMVMERARRQHAKGWLTLDEFRAIRLRVEPCQAPCDV